LNELLAKRASELSLILSKEAAELLNELPNALQVIEKIADAPDAPMVVSKQQVAQAADQVEAENKSPKVAITGGNTYQPIAADIAADYNIYESYDISGKSRCTGKVEDFVDYFKDRYKKLSTILKSRVSETPPTSIRALDSYTKGRLARVIVMVMEKKETKNGHLIVEVEDMQDSLTCLVSRDSPQKLKDAASNIGTDEVVALEGVMSKDLFIVRDVIFPEIPIRQKKLADEDVSVAYISDMHMGNRFFMKENFERMIAFLNGKGTPQEQEIAGKIKYFAVIGDCVDGIGVHPDQEKELYTKDIYLQYEIMCEYLKQIPGHIEVFVQPGNHDAVRLSEPQPRLLEEFVKGTDGYKNIHFVGNPSMVDMHGVKHLLYHGNGADGLIATIPALKNGYQQPEKVGVEMLKRRLICPTYGLEPITPEARDYLVIDEVPDVFAFGHLHKNAYADYRGTTVINSGCWQSITDYQVRKGHIVSPARLPVYNLHSGNFNLMHFEPQADKEVLPE
jgi:DNA polymerase II small subunit